MTVDGKITAPDIDNSEPPTNVRSQEIRAGNDWIRGKREVRLRLLTGNALDCR